MKKKIKGYMCGTDFEVELWAKEAEFPELFRTQAALKRARKMCWRECGIVEVEIKYLKKKHPGRFSLERMPIVRLRKKP